MAQRSSSPQWRTRSTSSCWSGAEDTKKGLRIPVLPPMEVVSTKLRALTERYRDFGELLQTPCASSSIGRGCARRRATTPSLRRFSCSTIRSGSARTANRCPRARERRESSAESGKIRLSRRCAARRRPRPRYGGRHGPCPHRELGALGVGRPTLCPPAEFRQLDACSRPSPPPRTARNPAAASSSAAVAGDGPVLQQELRGIAGRLCPQWRRATGSYPQIEQLAEAVNSGSGSGRRPAEARATIADSLVELAPLPRARVIATPYSAAASRTFPRRAAISPAMCAETRNDPDTGRAAGTARAPAPAAHRGSRRRSKRPWGRWRAGRQAYP